MKKLTLLLFLIPFTTNSFAEAWTNGFSHGSEEYKLKNDLNQTLNYSCNEGMSDTTENGFWLTDGNEVLEGEDGLAIMTNTLYFTPFPKETSSTNGSLQGILFTAQLAMAKNIDVFREVKDSSWIKIASFTADKEAAFKECPTVFFKKFRS